MPTTGFHFTKTIGTHGPTLRFDRLILATALHENWPVMSADGKFSLYKDLVNIIW
ncbi:hypothetical protein [Spirosoma areae]